MKLKDQKDLGRKSLQVGDLHLLWEGQALVLKCCWRRCIWRRPERLNSIHMYVVEVENWPLWSCVWFLLLICTWKGFSGKWHRHPWKLQEWSSTRGKCARSSRMFQAINPGIWTWSRGAVSHWLFALFDIGLGRLLHYKAEKEQPNQLWWTVMGI